MYVKIRPAIPMISLLILILVIINCKHEYPPFDEYEVVGFVPVDSVTYGMLFANGERLFALYDTTFNYNPGPLLREYSLQDPTNPTLQNVELLYLPPSLIFRKHQDSLVFYRMSYYDLLILNLNTLETHSLYLGYNVQDIVHREHFLFVSTYDGLRVLDISNLPDYVEVFNDSIYRYGAFLTLRDTILLDMYESNDHYRAKMWNIKNAENPQIIFEGELPGVYYLAYGPAMTEQYIIIFDHYAVHRYRHDTYDTLIYEDMLYIDQSYSSPKTSDSLIYLLYQGNRIGIIQMDDFDAEQITISGDYWNYQMLSFEIFEETIYVLVRRQGIHILQRRAS
ncbi:MAG: hypothetical protein OEV79_07575 [candidate division WOR-3 bacterium]|nr:hypothetical protein [candidate division WOR-3 bacterium]